MRKPPRARGMPTTEAIRTGTATTGRLITAAALVLVVVGGAFAFSDLVMMKYIAFGLITALLLDATVVRMFLVPSIMKLLGNECWWAPRWMKRLQKLIGLEETDLQDEREPSAAPAQQEESTIRGEVVYVDHFGNLVTNIDAEAMQRFPHTQAAFAAISSIEFAC